MNDTSMRPANVGNTPSQPTKPTKRKVIIRGIIALIISVLAVLVSAVSLLFYQGFTEGEDLEPIVVLGLICLVLTLVVFVYAERSIFGKKGVFAHHESDEPYDRVSPGLAGFWLGLSLFCIILISVGLYHLLSVIDLESLFREFYLLPLALLFFLVLFLFLLFWFTKIINHWSFYATHLKKILLGSFGGILLLLAVVSVPFVYDSYDRYKWDKELQKFEEKRDQRLQTDIHPSFMDFALWQSWDECDEAIKNTVNCFVMDEGTHDDVEYNRVSEDSIIYRYKIVQTAWQNMTINVCLFGDKDKVFGIFVKNDAGFSDLGEEPIIMLTGEYGTPEDGKDLRYNMKDSYESEDDMPIYTDYDDVWRFKNCYICYERYYGELLYIDSNYKLKAIQLRTTF